MWRSLTKGRACFTRWRTPTNPSSSRLREGWRLSRRWWSGCGRPTARTAELLMLPLLVCNSPPARDRLRRAEVTRATHRVPDRFEASVLTLTLLPTPFR
ncbi:hypothetical protein T492DRAFT_898275 [Pavlovales sp. CCMP2436]|nr:hypothetical protein T492DRAFT_898275 [Pavlovales sp. CCMP2436]